MKENDDNNKTNSLAKVVQELRERKFRSDSQPLA